MLVHSVRPFDIWQIRQPRFIEHLNKPDDEALGFSPVKFGFRSFLPSSYFGADVLLVNDGGRITAGCYVRSRRHSEEAVLAALTGYTDNEAQLAHAWERLVQTACLQAATNGKRRVVARVEDGADVALLLRKAGFTCVTRESVFWKQCSGEPLDPRPEYRPLTPQDEWDTWRLYNQTEPAAVKRAEGLTSSDWWGVKKHRPYTPDEWILRLDDRVAVHLEIVYGRNCAVVSMHYHPQCSDLLPMAIEHATALCAGRGVPRVQCVAREHQPELASLAQEYGFSLRREQVRMVLYTSILNTARAVRLHGAVEKVSPIYRTHGRHLSCDTTRTNHKHTDWYNCEGELNGTNTHRL